MTSLFLVRYNEIHLKGLNRPYFENLLKKNIQSALKRFSPEVNVSQGRIYVYIKEGTEQEITHRLSKVFGIHSISPCLEVEKDFESICSTAETLIAQELEGKDGATFKVLARRSDKRFPMNSDQINRELGGRLLNRFDKLKVDVHHPQIKVGVEIREQAAFLYVKEIPGPGGMPTGAAGKGVLLLSGGIDSPVAGYLMAKRGMELNAVHFYSYPYTSVRARDKVVDLAKELANYAGRIKVYLIPFTKIQRDIYDYCPEKETTVVMRRVMMKIAAKIASNTGSKALITGEALGQVASQTLESLTVTNDAANMLVMRPLLGFDKEDIVSIAKKIGTFETSILPYEDCCTVFVPKHPVTKPEVERLRQSEALLVNLEEDMQQAIQDAEVVTLFREE